MTPEEQKFVEKVAQEIVYCNCATEGPALRRCAHVSLAESLTAKLAPLFAVVEAAGAMVDWEQEYRTLNHLGSVAPHPFKQFKAALAELQKVVQ